MVFIIRDNMKKLKFDLAYFSKEDRNVKPTYIHYIREHYLQKYNRDFKAEPVPPFYNEPETIPCCMHILSYMYNILLPQISQTY